MNPPHQPLRIAGTVQTRYRAASVVLLLITAPWVISRQCTQIPQSAPSTPVQTVDINTAPWFELTILPGIGNATARAIVEYRTSHQPGTAAEAGTDAVFATMVDLDQVRGIGPVTMQRIAPFVRFGTAEEPAQP